MPGGAGVHGTTYELGTFLVPIPPGCITMHAPETTPRASAPRDACSHQRCPCYCFSQFLRPASSARMWPMMAWRQAPQRPYQLPYIARYKTP